MSELIKKPTAIHDLNKGDVFYVTEGDAVGHLPDGSPTDDFPTERLNYGYWYLVTKAQEGPTTQGKKFTCAYIGPGSNIYGGQTFADDSFEFTAIVSDNARRVALVGHGMPYQTWILCPLHS